MHSLQGLPSRISGSVGTPGKARNDSDDVRSIQNLFNLITPKTTSPLLVDGKCGPLLVQRIKDYQSSRLKVATPDGVIDPAGRTFNTLLEDARKAIPVTPANDSAGAAAAPTPPSPPAPAPAPADTLQLVTKATCDGRVTLTDVDFQSAATALGSGISVNIIKAFATVESGGRSGFGPAQMPVIAYEGHIFRKYTQQKYDKAYPLLSYAYREKAGPQWKANNKTQAVAWQTLADAFKLNQEAALMSASYGMFQIMGFNFAACGYKSVFDFVSAMKLNAGQQLMAFVGFCRKNPTLFKAMKNKDFAGMAAQYNGADYGDYDKRIQKAFEALERKK
ncbi:MULTISPECIES: N-acetylmuramidase family protein [Pseudomonas]|uniref:N-acetylmuramidase family protein n=1 Tax=Pseudomonas TaxID=286 RepID=UPI001464226E|nr:N-acetylmuramidase family protein [Pseudomonas sp. ADAK22]QJI16602.1 N-acetylmuramidase family protein [Pseudomonas sp. ADAK22]